MTRAHAKEMQPYVLEIEKQLRQLRKERNLIKKLKKVGQYSTKETTAGVDDDTIDLAIREASQQQQKATWDAKEVAISDSQIICEEKRGRRIA